jgi:hypothetical protein
MKVLGFCDVPWHDSPGGLSLKEAVRPAPHPHQAGILAYLRAGRWFAVRPMVVEDVLQPERGLVSDSHWYTDGVWIWATDVIYYVERYHIELPTDFVTHMAAKGWSCPPVAPDGVLRIAKWWQQRREGEKAEPGAPADGPSRVP